MKDITIIIPVHEYNDNVSELLARAINSIPEKTKVIISCANGLGENFKKTRYITIIENPNEGITDFSSLVNEGVNNVETPYFSILEFDDEYTDIWFTNVETYMEDKNDVSVFLPMEDLLNYTDGKFVGFGNEAPWASSFSNEVGYIDNDCLQNYFDFYLTGGVFNTDDWKTYGGLKPSIKVSFWYEFLLRLTHNGKKVYVIPKIGYKHYVNRLDSLFVQYNETIEADESNWWFELAKKEYFFKEDRNKTYENNNEEGEN